MMGTIGKDFLMNKWESANTFINYLVNAVSKNLWFLLITATIFLLILTMIEKVWKRLNEKSLSEYHGSREEKLNQVTESDLTKMKCLWNMH